MKYFLLSLAQGALLGLSLCALGAEAQPELNDKPLAVLMVTQCSKVVVVWVTWPTRVVRFDADHQPPSNEWMKKVIDAATLHDIVDAPCMRAIDTGAKL